MLGLLSRICCCRRAPRCLWWLRKCPCETRDGPPDLYLRCIVREPVFGSILSGILGGEPTNQFGFVIGDIVQYAPTGACYRVSQIIFPGDPGSFPLATNGFIEGQEKFDTCEDCCPQPEPDCYYRTEKCPNDPGIGNRDLHLPCEIVTSPPESFVFEYGGVCYRATVPVSTLPPDGILIEPEELHASCNTCVAPPPCTAEHCEMCGNAYTMLIEGVTLDPDAPANDGARICSSFNIPVRSPFPGSCSYEVDYVSSYDPCIETPVPYGAVSCGLNCDPCNNCSGDDITPPFNFGDSTFLDAAINCIPVGDNAVQWAASAALQGSLPPEPSLNGCCVAAGGGTVQWISDVLPRGSCPSDASWSVVMLGAGLVGNPSLSVV